VPPVMARPGGCYHAHKMRFTRLFGPLLLTCAALAANTQCAATQDRERTAGVIERCGRDAEQKPQKLVEAIGLKPGMTVADVGTGSGYMLPYLSRAVGPKGRVLAEDIFSDVVARARRKAENARLTNVTIILGSATSANLPEHEVDVAFLLNTYHHFDSPESMLASIRNALRENGRLAVVDLHRRPEEGAHAHARASQSEFIREIEAAGFRLLSKRDHIPGRQYILMFELDRLAATPPMGWNSWDSYGTSVTEAEVKANADYMAANLKSHGWQYIVVDIQWYEPNAKAHGYRPGAELVMDAYGRLLPAVNRFPSAAAGKGFGPLAAYVHSKGLKFGIHIMRGIPRQAVEKNLPILGSKARAADIADRESVCAWNTDMYGVDMKRSGAQDYYDSIVKLYADWGVDYIKADDIAAPVPHQEEIEALSRAIRKSGRPIVLSLSPGPAPVADAAFFAENAQLWRVANDRWDRWKDVRESFGLLAAWSPFARPGAWPDGDMLPLGRIGVRAEVGDDRRSRLSRVEQRTLMTLWSIARSPLMYGGDLPSSDAADLELITNDEVLAVDQNATRSRELFSRGNEIAWTSDDIGSPAKYLAVFNTGDHGGAKIHVSWSELGLPPDCELRDLWERKDLGTVHGGYEFEILPHGSGLYRLKPGR
jgi:alpha-galactosidase